MCRSQSKSPKTGSDAVASHLYFGDFVYFQPLDLSFRNSLNVNIEKRSKSTMHETITSGEIKVSPFDFISIQKLKITAGINEHSSLYLVGILPDTQKDKDLYTDNQTPIVVSIESELQSKTIFCGMITEIKVTAVANYYELHVKAKSYTYLMDIKKHKRSFQDVQLSWHQLIRQIVKTYPQGSCIFNTEEEATKRIWVQYSETDWEFIKRVASHYHLGLFPYISQTGTRFYIGETEYGNQTIDSKEYMAVSQLEQFEYMKEHEKLNVKEADYLMYTLKSNEFIELGEKVQFKKKSYYNQSLTYQLVNGVVENTYVLVKKNGLKQPRSYGNKLTGVSIEGKVLAVAGDKVKVHLEIDKEQNKSTAHWFPYSTPAASTDGSGWYFMPEVKDSVRVYFPGNEENEAFAISSIRETGGNPEVKYIQTIYDKKVMFTKDSVIISADGQATVTLSKNGGISISGGSISINASQSITMRSEDTMNISAADSVSLQSDQGGKVILNESGEIKLNGTEVKIN